ncbi:MAG: dockerin type I repeat-containing protein [Phycisphaerales bacterium]
MRAMGTNPLICIAPLWTCAAACASSEVLVSDLAGLTVYAPVAAARAMSVGGTWCNLGPDAAPWNPLTSGHPVTATNLLRVENGGLREIGVGWAWHHVNCALQLSGCATCAPVPGPCPPALGAGCTTTSTAAALGTQGALGMRSQVNASAATFPFPLVEPPVTDGLSRRCRYQIADVDPAQHPNAHFAAQTVTIAASTGAPVERSAIREIAATTLANGGSAYAGAATTSASAVDFWKSIEPSVAITVIDIANDGRILVASRVAPVAGGYRYDYAIENLNSHESVGAFEVPVGSAEGMRSITFAAPLVHSGEVTSNAPWTSSLDASTLTWATTPFAADPNANAIRWGTTYSFSFVSPQAPATRVATITLFRSAASVDATVSAPRAIGDLDGDGVVNSIDLGLLLGAWGRCASCAADLDGDGVVGSADLAILLGAWE